MKLRGGGRAWLLSLGALSLAGLVTWAALRQSTAAAPRQPTQAATQASERPLPRVSTLHEQRASAYHASLFAGEGGVVVTTPAGFTTIAPGMTVEEHAVDLGAIAVSQGRSIVFWRSAQLREIALSGEGERQLTALPNAPQYLLASEGRVAWVYSDRTAGSALHTLSGEGAREVYESAGRVCAAVLRGANVYWVLQARDGSWTIESVDLDGAQHTSTAAHPGRPPAMLALGRDGVYFYAGVKQGVRKLSFDLAREEAVLSNVVCSPISVSSRVVCAQVGGLFEIIPSAGAPRFLASEPSGPIAATVATDDRAFWVAENGDGRLVVRTVPLSEL